MHFFKDWLWWNDEKFPEDSEGELRRLRNKMEWRFHILLLWAEQSDPWEFYSTYFNGKCHIFWLLEGERGTLLHNIKKKTKTFLRLHMLNFKHFFPHLQLQYSSPSMPVVLSLSLSTLPFCFSSHCNSSLTPRLSKYLMQQLSNKTKFGQNSLFVHKYFGEFMSCAKIRAAKFLKSLLKTELTQQQLNNQTKTEPQIQTEILLIYHFNLSKMECGTSDENNLY